MASRKLLVDRFSFVDKNLMFFLLFSFVPGSVGQQGGAYTVAASVSLSGTLLSTPDTNPDSTLVQLESTAQHLPSVHLTSSPYVRQTSTPASIYIRASFPTTIGTTPTTTIGTTPTTTLTSTGITSISTVATPASPSTTLGTISATPTTTVTTLTTTPIAPTSTITTPTSTVTTLTSTVTTPTSTVTTPTSTVTTPTLALPSPNTTTTTLTTTTQTVVPTLTRPSPTMVKVPPNSTLTLPHVLFLAIPVGLGLLLVSTVIVLCGVFVCFKRKSKYGKEEAKAMNKEEDGLTMTKRKDSDCQAEWNNIDCTKFELPVQTVDTFGVTMPKSLGESLPDLQSTVTTHSNGCQTNEAVVTNQERKAILTSRMKPSLSVGALGVHNPMYQIRSTADEMGLMVNEQPPPGHAYISKRAASTGALHQHSLVNTTNQHPPTGTNTSQYYQVPSSLPVCDMSAKPNPLSSGYDVPRSAMNAWLAENSNTIEQLRVQFPSHYDVPRHALATARQQILQQNMQRVIPDPIPCANPPQQGPHAVKTSDDSKSNPYSTYDVPKPKSSTLPSNHLPTNAEHYDVPREWLGENAEHYDVPREWLGENAEHYDVPRDWLGENAEHYDVPREWLEAKLALMNRRGKQTRNRSYTAFSKPDGVYDVPRQMLPLKVVNNEQARVQMQRQAGVLAQHQVHTGSFDGVVPPIPRHGRWSDDDSDTENLYDEPPISPQRNNSDTHYFPQSPLSDEELYAEPPQESVAEVIQLGILEERIARAKRGNGGDQVNQTIHEAHNPDRKRICSRSQSFKEVHQQLQQLIMRAQQPTEDSQVNPTATELSSEVAHGHRPIRQLSEKRLPPPVKQKPPSKSSSLRNLRSATLS